MENRDNEIITHLLGKAGWDVRQIRQGIRGSESLWMCIHHYAETVKAPSARSCAEACMRQYRELLEQEAQQQQPAPLPQPQRFIVTLLDTATEFAPLFALLAVLLGYDWLRGGAKRHG